MKLELIGKYGDINAQNIIASLERTGNSLDQNKALLLRNAIDKLWKTKKFRKYMKKKMAKEEALIIFRGKLSPRARQEPEAFSRLCDLLYGLHRHNRYHQGLLVWFAEATVMDIFKNLFNFTPSQEAQPEA